MNTKIVMTASAVLLGAVGLIFTFMPVETLQSLNLEMTRVAGLFIQIMGALYFSFAMLNWMTRESIIGGIYNRPVAMANFVHFFMAGIALLKRVASDSGTPYQIYAATVIYVVFAILYGLILFQHPAKG
jgi:hypothetical protein